MKIIKNNHKDKIFPVKIACRNCRSVVELERTDCTEPKFDYQLLEHVFYFTCPCCNRTSWFSFLDD